MTSSPSPIVAAESLVTVKVVDPFENLKRCMHYDWDGHGSSPITLTSMREARRVKTLLEDADRYGEEIIPGPNGSVRFRWVYDRKPGEKKILKIDLDIGPGRRAACSTKFADGKAIKSNYTRIDGDDIDAIFSSLNEEESSNLCSYAKRELERAGMFDKDADYGGMLGNAVMDLIRTFSKQGHSGFSASMTRELFHTLSQFKPLGKFVPTIEESMEVAIDSKTHEKVLQSTRKSSVFSNDGGKTWHDVDDPEWSYTNYNYPSN